MGGPPPAYGGRASMHGGQRPISPQVLTKLSRPPSLCHQCTPVVFLGLINTCGNRNALPPTHLPTPWFLYIGATTVPKCRTQKKSWFCTKCHDYMLLKPLILCKFCGSFHENSDKKSQKSLEMVSKKSWFCPKGLNFAFVASFRAKSQILYRNAWKGPQLRNWSSWGPNCWNGPHFPQKVSCSPFPKCVSLQYVHFLHEIRVGG